MNQDRCIGAVLIFTCIASFCLLLTGQRDTQLELALLRSLAADKAVCEAVTFGSAVDMKIAESWVKFEYGVAEK